MLFNSIEFALFLPIVFIIYWLLTSKNLRIQNILILISSYIFYGWWDWRFLSLIAFSSFADYFIGLNLYKTNTLTRRKLLLWLSIIINIGLLGFFKYYNFFVQSFSEAFTLLGKPIEARTLKIILPVGISFYTFQTLSYTIDIYRKKLKPSNDIISFFAFVSFFPQLVAGPIERAVNLLPQFYKKRELNYDKFKDGVYQIIWGLFKKVVIADNCAIYANDIFSNYSELNGSTLLLGAFFFAFQIYGDFSGYSDIAIGTARLFGFNLMTNFSYPYFSRDIAEFWRRWHISLSTWFRDYLYIPLGGSRGNNFSKIKNVFIIFIVSGFWHGANWTFIIWGALNAVYFLPLMLLNRNRLNTDIVAQGKLLPNFKDLTAMVITFILTLVAWVFFRAESVSHAFSYLSGIFSKTLFLKPTILPIDFLIIIFLFVMLEWLNRAKLYPLAEFKNKNFFRFILGSIIVWSIILWGAFDNKEFIYFQF